MGWNDTGVGRQERRQRRKYYPAIDVCTSRDHPEKGQAVFGLPDNFASPGAE
jgi:hypothetical protein